jgi:hypothetical protein
MVTGTDLSPGDIQISREEALARSLPMVFSVADMRQAGQVHQR